MKQIRLISLAAVAILCASCGASRQAQQQPQQYQQQYVAQQQFVGQQQYASQQQMQPSSYTMFDLIRDIIRFQPEMTSPTEAMSFLIGLKQKVNRFLI